MECVKMQWKGGLRLALQAKKREKLSFLPGFIYQSAVFVASQRLGTNFWRVEQKRRGEISRPELALLHKWARSGISGVIITHFCNCSVALTLAFLTFKAGREKKWHDNVFQSKTTCTCMASDLLTKIRHKWPGLWRWGILWFNMVLELKAIYFCLIRENTFHKTGLISRSLEFSTNSQL